MDDVYCEYDRAERGKECALCREGYPLSEVDPKHEWYDAESGKVHEAPCYFDRDNTSVADKSSQEKP